MPAGSRLEDTSCRHAVRRRHRHYLWIDKNHNLNEWLPALTLSHMTSLAGFFVRTNMQHALLGADATDPVMPDHGRGTAPPRPATDIAEAPLRLGRFDDGLATAPEARSRHRVGTFADGLARPRRLQSAPALDHREPTPALDGADQRRAA